MSWECIRMTVEFRELESLNVRDQVWESETKGVLVCEYECSSSESDIPHF